MVLSLISKAAFPFFMTFTNQTYHTKCQKEEKSPYFVLERQHEAESSDPGPVHLLESVVVGFGQVLVADGIGST